MKMRILFGAVVFALQMQSALAAQTTHLKLEIDGNAIEAAPARGSQAPRPARATLPKQRTKGLKQRLGAQVHHGAGAPRTASSLGSATTGVRSSRPEWRYVPIRRY